MIDLIYCAGGNPRLSEIALEEGWQVGMRSDASHYHKPLFIDIDYKHPNFDKHINLVKQYRPKYATILDLSDKDVSAYDILRALYQYDLIKEYCEVPLIVPKLSGQIELLPEEIAIGYSIPSSYGGAQYPLWELKGRRVHLLGGSPGKQIQTYLHLSSISEIVSLDSNYAQLMATRYGEYWENHKWIEHPGVRRKEKNIYFECWRRSCSNLFREWQRITGGNT